MGFVGSTKYYILCGISLVALLTGLAILIRQSSSAAKSKHPHKAPPSERAPKYAAGDEMDRINRNAYITPRKKRSIVSLLFAVIALAGALFLYIQRNTLVPTSQTLPAVTRFIAESQSPSPSEPIPTDGKYPTVVINSTDYSQDLSKIFVTLTTSNKTDISFYAITTTLKLKDENDITLQDEPLEVIDSIKPGEEKEITVAITINPENIGKIRLIRYETQFYYQQP